MNNQSGNQYFCDQCDAKFYKKRELDSHKSLVHIENKPHMCPICSLSFVSNYRLQLHNESVHEKKKPYKCSSCGFRCSLKGSMTKHIAKVHEGANIEIIYLGDNPYKCANCDFSTAMKSNLTKHIEEVHDGRQDWNCELCDSTFTNRSNLNSHVRQVHEGKKRKKKSRICKLQEKSVKVDDGKSNVFCDYCGSNFSNQSNLNAHIRQVHEGKKRIKGKSEISADQVNLIGHLIDEDQEEDHIDDFDNTDNFESEYNSNLPVSNEQETSDHEVGYAHQKSSVHDRIKLFECTHESCESNFSNQSNLNAHICQVHEGKKRKNTWNYKEKLCQCTFCDYTCSNPSNMRTHVSVVHEGNKPFKCEICDYSCGIKSNLKKHMAQVHKQSNEPKINKAPIMPFLFGGINHVKPIELTKIKKD